MPTYEYRCPACGRDFELFQRMSDPPGAPCPDCGEAAERLISAGAGLLFKGEGFYITDYRSDAYKEKAKQDGGDKKEKDSGGGADKDGGGKDRPAKDRTAKDGVGKGGGDAGRKASKKGVGRGSGKGSKGSGTGTGGSDSGSG